MFRFTLQSKFESCLKIEVHILGQELRLGLGKNISSDVRDVRVQNLSLDLEVRVGFWIGHSGRILVQNLGYK